MVRLEDSEEDKAIVAGSSEKRFVTFLQQVGSLSQHQRPKGLHEVMLKPFSTLSNTAFKT